MSFDPTTPMSLTGLNEWRLHVPDAVYLSMRLISGTQMPVQCPAMVSYHLPGMDGTMNNPLSPSRVVPPT